MAYSLKNMWAAMAVSLVAATSVNAAPFYDNQPYGDTLGCCPCGPVRPCVDPCGNWFVDAEFLYWNASEQGLEFTTEFESGSSSSGLRAKTKSPCNNWGPGVRLGLGYDLPCDGWDVVAYWTYLYTRSTKSTHNNSSNGDDFVVDNFVDGSGNNFGRNHARWILNLNLLDVELGREFCCSPCLTLRPFIAIRAAWIDQRFNIGSHGSSSSSSSSSSSFSGGPKLKTRFSGAGLRGGLDSEWKFGWCGLSLYGEAAASILYGEYRSTFHNRCDCFRFETETCGGAAIADAAIGLRWREYFCCDTIALTVDLGYETHYFWNQNRFPNPERGVRDSLVGKNRGDLTTNGITLAARVAF